MNSLTAATTGRAPAESNLNGGMAAQEAGPERAGEAWNKIQAQYGEKTQKPREIKKTLGKDDFLKIMVMQMKNQDPTKPFDPEQMGMQMAQFASVEQLQNMNKSLEKLTSQTTPTEKMAMTQMIGKWVTLDKSRFQHTENTPSTLSFDLPKDAASVNIQVLDASGEAIYSKSLGEMKSGTQSTNWDGLRGNGLPVKSGTYNMRVVASDKNGASIPIKTLGQSQVIGVSFEGNEPLMLVGDHKNSTKVGLKFISKISTEKDPAVESESAQPKTGVEEIMAGALGKQAAEKTNLTELKKTAPVAAEELGKTSVQDVKSKNAMAMNSVLSNQGDQGGWPSGLQQQSQNARGGDEK